MLVAAQSAAVRILEQLHDAEDNLVGAVVSTFIGRTGTCKDVKLDGFHGLCFTFDDPVSPFDEIICGLGRCGLGRKWYPISTIRVKL